MRVNSGLELGLAKIPVLAAKNTRGAARRVAVDGVGIHPQHRARHAAGRPNGYGRVGLRGMFPGVEVQ